MVTQRASLMRSLDSGKTWTNETTRLPEGTVPAVLQSDQGPRGGVSDGFANADGSIVYFVGYDGRLWVTSNAGDTYTLVRPGAIPAIGKSNSPIFALQAHPTQPRTAALILTDPCCISSCNYCTYRMLYSSDGGISWSVVNTGYHVAAPMYAYFGRDYPWWGFGPNTTDGIVYRWGLVFMGFKKLTEDYNADSASVSFPELIIQRDVRQPLSASGNMYLQVLNTKDFFYDGYVLLATVFNSTSLSREAWMATEFGETSTFIKRVRIPPPPDATEKSRLEAINIIDMNDGAIWLSPDWNTPSQANTDYFSGDLYIDADPSSTGRFSWTLRSLNQEIPGRKDITPILSVDGAYIANSRPDRANPSKWVSYMTWNKGARWDPIPIPTTFQCPGCSLNFLLPFSGGYIKSSKSAPGIVIANGYASKNGAETNGQSPRTFISTNGGLTWTPIAQDWGTEEGLADGHHLFEILENGAVIAMIDKETTDHLAWSNTGGLGQGAWKSCTYDPAGAAKLPVSIFSDPQGATQSMLLLTLDSTVPGPYGTGTYELWHFNFTGSIARDCVASDYEQFNVESPGNNGTDDYCVMGRRLSYYRKKPTANCGNADQTRILDSTSCPCMREDFICSDCFVPSADGTTCELEPNCAYLGESDANPPENCPTGSNYSSTETGYDLIAGNQCFRGAYLDLGTRSYACPPGRTGVRASTCD